jgi:geranylgeranyl pyrophosphate synthase
VASCEVGGIAGGATEAEIDALGTYGGHLGVAFQIRDDVLDYTASEEELGKPVGKDAVLERPSLVALHSRENGAHLADSIEFARSEAEDRAEAAREALEPLATTEAREEMRGLTEFAVERSN